MKHENIFENEQLKFELKNGILFTHYKAGLKLKLEDIQKFTQIRLNLLNNNCYPTIIFDHGIISMDKSARDYFISKDGLKGISTAVFIQNTFFSKMLFRFILQIKYPPIPIITFRDCNDAIFWIKNNGSTHQSFSKSSSDYKDLSFKKMQPAA